jgi:broad specificity phosphatase PhoE
MIFNFISHLNTSPKAIYFTRHGESVFNAQNRVGGDSELSSFGVSYARVLGTFLRQQEDIGDGSRVKLITSTMKRTNSTAEIIALNTPTLRLKCLDEIDVGIFDCMTYGEI